MDKNYKTYLSHFSNMKDEDIQDEIKDINVKLSHMIREDVPALTDQLDAANFVLNSRKNVAK